MKYHTMIVKTISEHIIMLILHFWVNMRFLNKNSFNSQNRNNNHLISACNSDFDWFKGKGYTSIHQTERMSLATSIATPLGMSTSS